MRNYEITVRPLSDDAKAAGCETLVTEVDAFILSAASDMGDEKVHHNVQVRGPEIVWSALVNLLQKLAKDFPKEFSAVILFVIAFVMDKNGDKKMN